MLTIQGLSRAALEPLEPALLSNIDMDVGAGCCVVISGPSGAGKTLFLRALIDLDPNNGAVSLNSKNREALSAPDWRKRVCYVPAEPDWWANTVKEHFQDLNHAQNLASTFGLSDRIFEQPVNRLSTGERQRLALVRALLVDPDVLLLDEPTSALDPQSTEQVEQALVDFMGQGKSVILVTHDEAQGGRMGHDFYVMANGQLSRSEKAA